MNMKELKEKNEAELTKLLSQRSEKNFVSFVSVVAGSAMRNVHAGKNLRREVAQVLTELTRRNAKSA